MHQRKRSIKTFITLFKGKNERKNVPIEFPGRLIMLGFGSVGQGVLPLIMRHIRVLPEHVTVLAPDERGRDGIDHFGVRFFKACVYPSNLKKSVLGFALLRLIFPLRFLK